MRPPEFWETGGWPAKALAPLSLLYQAGAGLRAWAASPYQPSSPVICVGNLTVGGAGKTPLVQALARSLKSRGRAPQIQTRGYGGKWKGPLKVDPNVHSFHQVGDETLLHAAVAPTWMAKNRADGVSKACQDGAEVVIMDDGHQNPSVRKSLSILAVDGPSGFGNGYVVPAGPLREPVATGLKRAHAAVIIGPDAHGLRTALPGPLPVLTARLMPDAATRGLAGQRVVAFAGIGRPMKFFESLAALGARVLAVHPFEDHYAFGPADIQSILDEAFQLKAIPVTTEKDAVRLTPDQRQQVNVARVRLDWDNPSQLDDLLGPVTG